MNKRVELISARFEQEEGSFSLVAERLKAKRRMNDVEVVLMSFISSSVFLFSFYVTLGERRRTRRTTAKSTCECRERLRSFFTAIVRTAHIHQWVAGDCLALLVICIEWNSQWINLNLIRTARVRQSIRSIRREQTSLSSVDVSLIESRFLWGFELNWMCRPMRRETRSKNLLPTIEANPRRTRCSIPTLRNDLSHIRPSIWCVFFVKQMAVNMLCLVVGEVKWIPSAVAWKSHAANSRHVIQMDLVDLVSDEKYQVVDWREFSSFVARWAQRCDDLSLRWNDLTRDGNYSWCSRHRWGNRAHYSPEVCTPSLCERDSPTRVYDLGIFSLFNLVSVLIVTSHSLELLWNHLRNGHVLRPWKSSLSIREKPRSEFMRHRPLLRMRWWDKKWGLEWFYWHTSVFKKKGKEQERRISMLGFCWAVQDRSSCALACKWPPVSAAFELPVLRCTPVARWECESLRRSHLVGLDRSFHCFRRTRRLFSRQYLDVDWPDPDYGVNRSPTLDQRHCNCTDRRVETNHGHSTVYLGLLERCTMIEHSLNHNLKELKILSRDPSLVSFTIGSMERTRCTIFC